MLWIKEKIFHPHPYETEKHLEDAIIEVQNILFGTSRIYLDIKRLIGAKGKTNNIPDGYLIDLSSKKKPRLYVVENELSIHEPLKHIAVQILNFSLSFASSQYRVKTILKDALLKHPTALKQCEEYAVQNNFGNIDVLLEEIIYKKDAFNALVIIDEMPDELEIVLSSRFKFPVEFLTLQRYIRENEIVYQFEPFMQDVSSDIKEDKDASIVDPSDIDTIVVPAKKDGFEETFIGENCWHQIRMHSSMLPKIKYIAAYQVAPVSAITHIAAVKNIEHYKGTGKYILYFEEAAKQITPIKLVTSGKVKAPQAPRYTSKGRIDSGNTLDDIF